MARPIILALISVFVVESVRSNAAAQVVVLPSGQITSIGTTVNVPDGGFVLLGNVSYGAEGMVQRGIPGLSYLPIIGMAPLLNHRGYGAQKGQTQIYIGVRIHDFEALDRATFLKGQQIIEAKRAAGLLPVTEKPLPARIPAALQQSFSSERQVPSISKMR